jgi:hypothetical protein
LVLWLVAGGWFIVREKYCWLVADKPSEQGEYQHQIGRTQSIGSSRTHRPEKNRENL